MAFGMAEGLSVQVSAATKSFERKMGAAKDSVEGLSVQAVQASSSLQVFQNRTDEAEDEVGRLGRSATTSSLSLTGLSASAKGAGLSLSGLSTTLTVGLLPTLALLSTALVPITAALGGLAAIVGSIGLVAFAGVLGAVKTNTQLLKQEAQDLVAELKQEFAPFLDAFAGALVTLIDRLQAVISQLAPTQAEAERLANSLVQIGTAVIGILPALSELVLSLTQEFLPPLIELAQDVLPEVPGFVRGLVTTFKELAPTLSGTGAFLVTLTKELFDLGMTVLNVATPAFSGIGGAITGLLGDFNDLSGSVRQLAVAAGLLVGPLGVLVYYLGGPLSLAITGIVAGIVLFRDELATLGAAIANNLEPAISLFNDLESIGQTALGEIQVLFTENSGAIQRFGEVGERAITGYTRYLEILGQVAGFVFGQILGPFLLDLSRLIRGRLGPVLDSLSGVFNEIFNEIAFVAKQGGKLWSIFGDEIKTTAKFIGDVIGTSLIAVFDGLITTFEILALLLQRDLSGAFTAFVSLGERTINRFTELLNEWSVVAVLTGILDSIISAVSTAFTQTLPQLFVLGLGLSIAALETLGDKLFNAFVGPFNAISEAVNNIFEGIANGIIDALNGAIDSFEALINRTIESLPSEITSQLGFDSVNIESVGDVSTTAATQDLREMDQQQNRQETVREVAVSLGFDVQGEGPLAEFVKQNAEATVEERERRTKRQTGGTTGL